MIGLGSMERPSSPRIPRLRPIAARLAGGSGTIGRRSTVWPPSMRLTSTGTRTNRPAPSSAPKMTGEPASAVGSPLGSVAGSMGASKWSSAPAEVPKPSSVSRPSKKLLRSGDSVPMAGTCSAVRVTRRPVRVVGSSAV